MTHEDVLCTVCRYPRHDGVCRNPVCGETDAARERFAAAAERRERDERERAERQRLLALSFRAAFGRVTR